MPNAIPVRGFCDCGAPLKRFCSITRGARIKEDSVYCPACQEWYVRVKCFDVESLEVASDPRTNKTRLPDKWRTLNP